MEEVTREEFSQLASRVSVVTRYILEQSRRNGDDLAAVKTRLDRVEQKLDGLDARFTGFVRDFPRTVAETVREVLRERGER